MAAQVFRALQSSREAEACSTLLACLHKCLQPGLPKTSFHDSVEICLTLQVHPCLLLYTITPCAPQSSLPLDFGSDVADDRYTDLACHVASAYLQAVPSMW